MEEDYQDITETGVEGLKGLPSIGQSVSHNTSNFEDLQNFLNMQQQKERNYSYNQLMQQSQPIMADIPVGLAAMEYGVGDSRYDDEITNLQQIEDLNEFRARRQSGAAQIANGIGKAATTFGTTYLSSTIGSLIGLFEGIGNSLDDDEKTTFWNGVWNNIFNQKMSDVQEKMEEILPNYYTQEEQESPWYTNIFTANFLGDKLIKNSGFMGGSAAAMLTFGKLGTAFKITNALSKLGKAGDIASWLITNFLGSNGEAAIEAINSVKDNEKALNLNLDNFTRQRKQQIDDEYQMDIIRGVDENKALQRYQQNLSALNIEVEEYKNKQKDELTSAGNMVYGMNIAALMLTNGINMGSFIKGGYKNASHIWNNAVFRVGDKTGGIKDFTTKELSQALLNGTLKAEAGDIKHGAAKVAGRWALNSAAEGIQEGIQSEISTATEILTQSRLNKYAKDNNITDAYINPAATDEFINLSSAALEAWDQQFGSINSPGWEEVFIGALSSAIGLPNGKIDSQVRKDNTLQKRFKIGWQGGIAEAMDNIYSDKRKLQVMSEVLNEKLQDPTQIDIIRKAIGNLSIEDAKDQSIEDQDIRRYKNLEIAQAVTNALFFKDHGLLDAYLGAYEEFAKNITDDNLDQIIMSTYSKEKGESVLANEKREDLRQMYRNKAQSTVDKIKNILDNDRYLREKFTDKFDENHSDEALTELVYRKSLYDDTIRRKEELENQLVDLDGKEDEISKLQRADLNRAITQLDNQAKQLDEFIKHAFDDPEDYQKEIDKVREERIKYAAARDGISARLAYGQASDMNEIADIYYRGNIENRDDILNQAIDETEDKQQKQKLQEFQKFKENVDVMYDVVDETYDSIGTSEGVNRMRNSVKEVLDEIVIDALNDKDYLLNTISNRIEQKIRDIDNEINDKVNGPNLYDESGRFIQVQDMDRLMMLQHLQGLFENIKDVIDDVNDARDTGKKSDKAKSDEDWESMTDEEVGVALFGDEEESGSASLDEEESGKATLEEESKEENIPVSQDEIEQQILDKYAGRTISNSQVQNEFGVDQETAQNILDDLKEKGLAERGEVGKKTKHIYYAIPKKQQQSESKTQEQETQDKKTEDKATESETPNPEQNPEETENAAELEPEVLPENVIVEPEEEHVIQDYELDQQAVRGEIPGQINEDYNEGSDYVINDTLKGNNFAPYTSKGLKEGKLNDVPDKQRIISQADKVRIQKFIDKYMQKWLDATKDKNQNIHFITHDEHPEIIYLAIKKGEYTDFIKSYSDLLVVPANNEYNVSEYYIIIGTLGYYNPGKNPTKLQLASSKAQKKSFDTIRDSLFKEHENFEGYHVSKYTTTVKGFTDGFKIHDRSKKNSLKELLDGDRKAFTNPYGLTEDNLRVSYITGTEDQGYIEKFIRFNSADKRVALSQEAMQSGRVFVYVPTNRGYYMPMFVETMRFNDWFDSNRDTDLAKDIVKTLENLAESHPGDEERSKSLKDLYDLLVFSGDNRLVFAKNGTVIQESSLSKRIVYTQFVDDIGEAVLDDMDQIHGDNAKETKFDMLLNALYGVNPRIALNSALLDTNIGYYIDSNVLQTDFEVLGTMGSSFYVNPLDENMNVIELNDNDGFRNEFTSTSRQNNDVAIYVPMNIDGKVVSTQYWFNSYENKLYDANKTEIPYQGNEEIYIISNVVYGEINQNLNPSFKIKDAKYFEVGDNVVRKNVRSYEVLSESEKQDYFDKKQRLIEQEQKRKAKEEAEKEAAQKKEDPHDVEELPVEDDGDIKEFYLKQNLDEYVNDLIAQGVKRDSIVIEHHPETETEDEYWTVTIKQEQQDTEKIDEQVMQFIEKAVSLQLESEDEDWKMMDIKSDLCNDETSLYKFGKQLVEDIDDLNANDALHALLREFYKKRSFKGNYAAFRQAVLNLDDETVQNDILNCK